MDFIYLLFYASPELQNLDVENNPGPCHPVHVVYRILCCNVPSVLRNLNDLTVASSWYNIYLYSETLDLDRHHMSQLRVPRICCPVLCYDRMPLVM